MTGASPVLAARLPPFTRLRAALFAGLLLVTAFVWAPVLRNGFVWDDGGNLIGTAAQRGLSPRGIAWAFTTFQAGHYQPLTFVSYAVDDLVNGGTPAGVHATNLMLHLLAIVLVALLAERLLKRAGEKSMGLRTFAAFVSAAIFALHPIHVESVAWATERRDLLSAVLLLGATLAWLPAEPGPPRRLRASALFLAALLCKAQVGFPIALLALDVWPLRRKRTDALPALIEKLPLFLLSGLFSVTAFLAQRSAGALTSVAEQPVLSRISQAAYGLVYYVVAHGFTSFSPLHERPVPLNALEPLFVLAALTVAFAVGALVLLRRRLPAGLAAFIAFAGILLPVLGFVQSGVQLVADRYAYLAGVPLCLLAGSGVALAWARLRSPGARLAAGALLAALLGVWSVATRAQIAVWHDDETLWRRVLARAPSALAANNLGNILLARGDVKEGVLWLKNSLDVVPTYHRPWRPLAFALSAHAESLSPLFCRDLAFTLRRAAATRPSSALARDVVLSAETLARPALRSSR
ncbi:MAG: hypothetical protein ABIT01_07860 [Thermoanaerobaculia bacterium]